MSSVCKSVSSMHHCSNQEICNRICYICGLYTPPGMQKQITDTIREGYQNYFGLKIEFKKCTPMTCCSTCERNIPKGSLQFTTPMIWANDPEAHPQDCYICLCYPHTKHLTRRTDRRTGIAYPTQLKSVVLPNWFTKKGRVRKEVRNTNVNTRASDDDDDGCAVVGVHESENADRNVGQSGGEYEMDSDEGEDGDESSDMSDNADDEQSDDAHAEVSGYIVGLLDDSLDESDNEALETRALASSDFQMAIDSQSDQFAPSSELYASSAVFPSVVDRDDFPYNPPNAPKDNTPIKLTRLECEQYLVDHTYRERRKFLQLMKSHNSLEDGICISDFERPHEFFLDFFKDLNPFPATAYCDDIAGLMDFMGIKYNANDWRLYVDTGKGSLKVTLLHIGNELKPVPILISRFLKENYEHLKMIFHNLIKYHMHRWLICCDLKVTTILFGQQDGNPTYPCFLCLWNRLAKIDKQYTTTHYQMRTSNDKPAEPIPIDCPKKKLAAIYKANFSIKFDGIVRCPLRVILPPLHIALGLFTKFITALQKDGEAMQHLEEKFVVTRIKPAEMVKRGQFNGPEIKKIKEDEIFYSKLSDLEKIAFDSFVEVQTFILTSKKSPTRTTQQIADDFFKAYFALGISMSYKMHLVKSHLHLIPKLADSTSEQQGEKVHQDFFDYEQHYKGKSTVGLLAALCHRASVMNPQQYNVTE